MIFYKFLSAERLREELVKVDDKISHHKLKEGPIAKASVFVEDLKAQGKNNSEIDKILRETNLPSLQEIGKETLFNIYGWGSLHKKRNKILSRLKSIEG